MCGWPRRQMRCAKYDSPDGDVENDLWDDRPVAAIRVGIQLARQPVDLPPGIDLDELDAEIVADECTPLVLHLPSRPASWPR